MPRRSLLISFASAVTPDLQRRRERSLFEAGGYDELHLHVSTLAGDVLSIGYFHLDPGAGQASCWRRSTGGRAIAAGHGFVVVTVALPHRSALVSDDRYALKPEQVMNRCVRGVLAWLRRRGVDPVYPGLDLVTAGRRALVHLSFAEDAAGPTLFQAIVAAGASFATTTGLLDRVDPRGRIPAHVVSATDATSLRELAGGGETGEVDVAATAAQLGGAYAETFALDTAELDPGVTDLMVADDRGPADDAPPAPPADASTVTEHGLLGPVTVAASLRGGRIAWFGLSGDFVAPAATVLALEHGLVGAVASAEAIRAALDGVLDGTRHYLLGVRPAVLRALVARAVGVA